MRLPWNKSKEVQVDLLDAGPSLSASPQPGVSVPGTAVALIALDFGSGSSLASQSIGLAAWKPSSKVLTLRQAHRRRRSRRGAGLYGVTAGYSLSYGL